MRLITLLLLATLTLTGCSSIPFFGKDDDDKESTSETEGYTERDFYDVIQRNLNSSRWDDAITNLQALESQFPFGTYAEQAQLELIYAYHRSSDYEAAIAAADRFIRLHPRHPNVDYAYYIKGLSYLKQSRTFLDNFIPTDLTSRDPGAAREAFGAFSELLTLYPNSSYSADARKRMVFLRNLLAQYEIHAANYYFERRAYVAAANRGRYVVENFQQTPAVPDALAIMAEAYHLLGKDQLSQSAVDVLAANFPDYPSLDDEGNFAYQGKTPKQGKAWSRALTLGLYDNRAAPRYDTRYLYNPDTPKRREEKQAKAQQTAAQERGEESERSLLNKATFGLLGDDGEDARPDEEVTEPTTAPRDASSREAPDFEMEAAGPRRSLLNKATFGLVGDDGEERDDRSEDQDQDQDQEEETNPEEETNSDEEAETSEGKRSFLNKATFGIFGDDGRESDSEKDDDEGESSNKADW